MLFLERISTHSGDFSPHEKHALMKTHKKMKDMQWITENKWFIKQPFEKQSILLQQIQDVGLSLTKIDAKTLVDVYYGLMKQHVKQSTLPPQLALPVRVYILLISHVYRDCEDMDLLYKMSKILFRGIVGQIVTNPLLFHRGHILIFYEKMYSVLLDITQISGSPKFHCFVQCLVYMQQCMRAQLYGYRVNMFKKIYSALIISVFKHLCIHNHLEDMDHVFASHRVTTRGMVQKLVVDASNEDTLMFWKRCPQIREYFKVNVLKWSELKKNVMLWTLCKDTIDSELLSIQNVSSVDGLSIIISYSKNSTKEALHLLQRYPRVFQRQIINLMIHCVEKTINKTEIQSDTIFHFASSFLNQHMKQVLMVHNNEKSIMKFYHNQGFSSLTLLNNLLQITTLSEKSLVAWSELYGEVPLPFFSYFFKKVTTCAKIHVKRNNNAKLRSMLKNINETIRRLLKCGCCEWQHCDSVLSVYIAFVRCFHAPHVSLNQCIVHEFLRFGRCITMASYMQQSPSASHLPPLQTSATPQPHTLYLGSPVCAICYNTDETPFRQLPCGHVFHMDCMVKMIQHAPLNNSVHVLGVCPYCKTAIKPLPSIHNKDIHDAVSELTSFGFMTVE